MWMDSYFDIITMGFILVGIALMLILFVALAFSLVEDGQRATEDKTTPRTTDAHVGIARKQRVTP